MLTQDVKDGLDRLLADGIHTVYISGPMSGIAGHNFPAFNKWAAALRDHGFTVLNPAETAGAATHLPRKWYFKIDFSYIRAVDAVFLLPGWIYSEGAKAESIFAWQLGKPLFSVGRNFIVELAELEVDVEYSHYEVA